MRIGQGATEAGWTPVALAAYRSKLFKQRLSKSHPLLVSHPAGRGLNVALTRDVTVWISLVAFRLPGPPDAFVLGPGVVPTSALQSSPVCVRVL